MSQPAFSPDYFFHSFLLLSLVVLYLLFKSRLHKPCVLLYSHVCCLLLLLISLPVAAEELCAQRDKDRKSTCLHWGGGGGEKQ